MLRITPDTSKFIKHDIRICVSCKHARKINTYNKHDVGCALYKSVDVVYGNVVYDSALDIRRDEQACGMKGNFYCDVNELEIKKKEEKEEEMRPEVTCGHESCDL